MTDGQAGQERTGQDMVRQGPERGPEGQGLRRVHARYCQEEHQPGHVRLGGQAVYRQHSAVAGAVRKEDSGYADHDGGVDFNTSDLFYNCNYPCGDSGRDTYESGGNCNKPRKSFPAPVTLHDSSSILFVCRCRSFTQDHVVCAWHWSRWGTSGSADPQTIWFRRPNASTL